MVDVNKVQGWVQKAVADIAALGGDTKKIDSEAENQALSKLLAGDGLKDVDKEFIQGFMIEKQNVDTVKEDTENVCEVSVEEKSGEESVSTEDKTLIHKRKEGDTWQGLVEAYYPNLIEQIGLHKAIKAFQKELCTDENGNFDKAKFTQLIRANDLPKEIKMPLQVGGIDRVIGEVIPIKTKRATGAGRGTRPMDKIGRDEFVSTKQVGPSTYIATDAVNGTTASGATPEEAINNLEKTTGKK